MPADRLDAIVLGADVEGLFAAVSMASAGKHVAVFDTQQPGFDRVGGENCLVSMSAVEELDLVSHGLRLSSPPPLVALSGEQSLVLWPDLAATQASIAAHSPRDADAWEGFCTRIMRSAASRAVNGEASLSNWLLGATSAGDVAGDTAFLRATTLERVLDEEFTTPLLKGLIAQGALIGTGTSPRAPGSAVLLMRHSLLSLFGDTLESRPVSGGLQSLREALLASLKFCNTAEMRPAKDIKALLFERDAVAGVTLQDGTVLRAGAVVSTLRPDALSEWNAAGATVPVVHSDYVLPGMVRFRVRSVPALKGVNAGIVSSGAVLRLNPTLDRLTRAYGAYKARRLEQDFCLDMRILPVCASSGSLQWDVIADILYLPTSSKEGPWSGNRRERLIASIVKVIEASAPGFEASLEQAELLEPAEARTILESGAPAPLERQSRADPAGVPALRPSAASRIAKGLWVIEPSLVQGAGLAGLSAAKALGASARGSRSASDA